MVGIAKEFAQPAATADAAWAEVPAPQIIAARSATTDLRLQAATHAEGCGPKFRLLTNFGESQRPALLAGAGTKLEAFIHEKSCLSTSCAHRRYSSLHERPIFGGLSRRGRNVSACVNCGHHATVVLSIVLSVSKLAVKRIFLRRFRCNSLSVLKSKTKRKLNLALII